MGQSHNNYIHCKLGTIISLQLGERRQSILGGGGKTNFQLVAGQSVPRGWRETSSQLGRGRGQSILRKDGEKVPPEINEGVCFAAFHNERGGE